jgi:hypothetical protein
LRPFQLSSEPLAHEASGHSPKNSWPDPRASSDPLYTCGCGTGGGYWIWKRRSANSFDRFDKFDSGAAAGPMQGGGATNLYASSKFGGRMVYPDMQVCAPAGICRHMTGTSSICLGNVLRLGLHHHYMCRHTQTQCAQMASGFGSADIVTIT